MLSLLEGGDAVCVCVGSGGGGSGHSSLGEAKAGLGTAMRQLPNRKHEKKGWVGDPPDSR